MYISNLYHELPRSLGEDSNSDAHSQKWSSAIGIITAIIGNILISFALNTQRYAHMRIARERDEKEEELKQERKRQSNSTKYGTQQREIAEVRAKRNAEAEPAKYTLQRPEESSETDPLIPSVESLDRSQASNSDPAGSEPEDDKEEEEEVKEQSYLKSSIWWAGITMMTVGETGNFLAYGFAPASIVSPLGVVALISNCLIAPWLLRERFRYRDGVGVIIAVAGCVTVVLSASDSNPRLDPDSIWHLITRWEFETYLGITVVLILILMVASSRFGEKSILIDLGLMGLFGGYTALSTKGVASLLSSSIWRVITFPITYLLIAVLVGTAVMQIKYVNRALQRFDSTQVIPIQFVLFTLSVITGSAILYRDFERTDTQQAVKFVGGCALTFLGVWMITSGRHNGSGGDEEEGDEEDAINLVDEEGVQPEIRERAGDVRKQSFLSGSSKAIAGLDDAQLQNEPIDIPPANAAAIHLHSESTTSLSQEDVDAKQRPPKPPPIHATTSEPLVPRISHPSTPQQPQTPLRRNHSVFEPNTPTTSLPHPSTPNAHLDPNNSPRLLSRRSMVGIIPGPLSTPLSSSLSAIVADSLRRGVDNLPTPAAARRRALRLRSKLDGAAAPLKRHSIASGEMDFDEDDEGANGNGNGAGRPDLASQGRMRSLSATLGELFGGASPSGKGRNLSRTGNGSSSMGGKQQQQSRQRRDESEDEAL